MRDFAGKLLLACVALAMAAGPGTVAPAAEPLPADVIADQIAPYLDDQTVLVVAIDTERIDVEAIYQQAAGLVELSDEEKQAAGEVVERVNNWLGEFHAVGGETIFVGFSLRGFHPGDGRTPMFLIAPVAEGGDPQAMAGLLQLPASFLGVSEPGHQAAQPLGDVVAVGSSAMLEHLYSQEPTRPPGLLPALEATEGAPVQVLLLPSDDVRRVMRETLPPLPPELGGYSGEVLAAAFRWAALGIELPPELAIHVAVQGDNAEAAQALADFAHRGLELLARNEDLSELGPLELRQALAEAFTPQAEDDRVTLTLREDDGTVQPPLSALQTLVVAARRSARRSQEMNQIRQLALAILNKESQIHAILPPANYDDQGRPLLSWRVHILPYLEEEELYNEFHLDEPWDSEHNRQLIARMPEMYKSPVEGLVPLGEGMTTYVAPLGEATVFGSPEGVPIREITDGTSKTILLVEADREHAVIWTRPEDIEIDPQHPFRGLAATQDTPAVLAVFVDVHAARLSVDLDPETAWAMFTKSGGEATESP